MIIPKHIGIIPDGNRRWASNKGMEKQQGYDCGLAPALDLFRQCRDLGVEELTFYGFTTDNTKRPKVQRLAFTKACVDAVDLLKKEDAQLLVVGRTDTPMFPEELLPYTTRTTFGKGGMKVNFLVNYCPMWDIKHNISKEISRIDLIIRWGGMCRLSGFLPVQSVYSDFYVVPQLWPDYDKGHLSQALEWYNVQDITLGG